MKKTFVALLAAGVSALVFSGCYSTPEGRMKASVVPFAKDSLEYRYERPVDQIFAAAKEVLNLNGTLYGENTIKKTLEAKINNRTVWIAVDEVEPKVSRVKVQVRTKGGMTDIDMASEIATQIALRLR